MKYKSVIIWPDGQGVKSSMRVHDTEDLAHAHVTVMNLNGYEGKGEVFPESSEVRPVKEHRKCCGKCGAEV